MNCLLLSFLITNALFWGLFPHTAHCQVVNEFNKFLGTNIKCPQHMVHLFMGAIFYLVSIYVAQKDSPHFRK
jgi:hypothetical protein